MSALKESSRLSFVAQDSVLRQFNLPLFTMDLSLLNAFQRLEETARYLRAHLLAASKDSLNYLIDAKLIPPESTLTDASALYWHTFLALVHRFELVLTVIQFIYYTKQWIKVCTEEQFNYMQQYWYKLQQLIYKVTCSNALPADCTETDQSSCTTVGRESFPISVLCSVKYYLIRLDIEVERRAVHLKTVADKCACMSPLQERFFQEDLDQLYKSLKAYRHNVELDASMFIASDLCL